MPRSNKLTDHQAAVVKLRETPGISWSGVANQLGICISSAKSAHKGAMKKLDRDASGEVDTPQRDVGKPGRALKKYLKQMGQVTDKTLAEGLERVAAAILFHFEHNPEVIANATARDLSSMLGMAIEKRQLLRGEPTAITRFEDIRKLDDVAELLDRELKRRGRIIDVTPEEV